MKKKLNDPYIRNYDDPDKRIEIYDTLTSGLAVRITPKGSKSFVYRYRFKNKVKRYTIGRYPKIGLARARQLAGKLAEKVAKGVDPMEEKKRRKQTIEEKTFRYLANEFLTKYLPTLRPVTQRNYKRIIENELLPILGKYEIGNISKAQILSLLDKKAYVDESPVMANRIRSRLSRIFSFGIERGIIQENPIQTISKYRKTKAGSKVENKKNRYYNDDEIRELWQFFETLLEPTSSVLKILLICGQRKTETMRMRWENINEGVWTIPASLAKNHEEHLVMLPDMAIEVLENLKPITGQKEWVFASPKKKNKPLAGVARARKNIQKHSNVSDFTPHGLRRTVATYMAKLGIDRTVLGKILNHKGLSGDGQVTAIYDRHGYMDEKRQAMNRWAGHLQHVLEDDSGMLHKLG